MWKKILRDILKSIAETPVNSNRESRWKAEKLNNQIVNDPTSDMYLKQIIRQKAYDSFRNRNK